MEKDNKRKRIYFSSTSSSETCITPLRKRTIRDYFIPENTPSSNKEVFTMDTQSLESLSDRQLLLKLASDMSELKENTKYINVEIEDLKAKNESLANTVKNQQSEIKKLKSEIEKIKLL